MTKTESGTREWAEINVNCVRGCSHDCRYCYARANALRFGRIQSADEWPIMRVNDRAVRQGRRKRKGRIMFPTAHDITPEVLEPCIAVLGKLLAAGNDMLIVSKPHRECIGEICERFRAYRPQILFRFSIGAMDNGILNYWEPGAPSYAERRRALSYAWAWRYATSVSCEPLLDAAHVTALVEDLKAHVTETIWIGTMREIGRRVRDADPIEVARIQAGQTPQAMRRVYELLKDDPQVRWKDSYRKVLGPATTTEN